MTGKFIENIFNYYYHYKNRILPDFIIKLENNFMSKFVFVEHKSIQDNEKKKDVVYFRYEKYYLFILIILINFILFSIDVLEFAYL